MKEKKTFKNYFSIYFRYESCHTNTIAHREVTQKVGLRKSIKNLISQTQLNEISH